MANRLDDRTARVVGNDSVGSSRGHGALAGFSRSHHSTRSDPLANGSRSPGTAPAVTAGHGNHVRGPILQLIFARVNRRRFDQGLLRGARNPSQENGSRGDRVCRSTARLVVDAFICRTHDAAQSEPPLHSREAWGLCGPDSLDAGRLHGRSRSGFLGWPFETILQGARFAEKIAKRRIAGALPGLLPPIRTAPRFCPEIRGPFDGAQRRLCPSSHHSRQRPGPDHSSRGLVCHGPDYYLHFGSADHSEWTGSARKPFRAHAGGS